MDPRAPLSVRVLPAYRIVATGLRLAVLALQRHRDRRVPGGAAGPRQNTRGSAPAGSAISARAVLDPPFSRPGRSSRGRVVRVHRPAARAEFRGSRTRHAPRPRLDSRASFPVLRPSTTPAGLVPFAHSRRPPRRDPARRRARLSVPTHHLSGTGLLFALRSNPRRKQSPDARRQDRKDRPVPLWTHCTAGAGNPPARRTDAPRPGDRLASLRYSEFHAPPGFGGHPARMDAALPPQRPHRAHAQAARGSRTDARHPRRHRRAHRTAQARKPASHRNGLAEPSGPGRRSSRNLTLHALSIPARPWTHRAPTAAR